MHYQRNIISLPKNPSVCSSIIFSSNHLNIQPVRSELAAPEKQASQQTDKKKQVRLTNYGDWWHVRTVLCLPTWVPQGYCRAIFLQKTFFNQSGEVVKTSYYTDSFCETTLTKPLFCQSKQCV